MFLCCIDGIMKASQTLLCGSAKLELLKAIANEGWLQHGMNQAMCFGNLPPWASDLAAALPVHLFSRQAWPTICMSKGDHLQAAKIFLASLVTWSMHRDCLI